jgi:acetyltransferase-like isoleucine patch superfamily enzyme
MNGMPRMIYNIHRFISIIAMPTYRGWLGKALFSCRRIRIGLDVKMQELPSINVERGATLRIGNGVEIRKDVEIRAHGTSSIVIEDNVRIDRGVRILAANQSRIHIGKGTRIGLHSVLNGGADITIGARSLVSGFVYLQTSMHRHEAVNMPMADQGYAHAPVTLGEDVWLGAHVVVLPGVVIGDHSIVGSNAVVTQRIEANQTWAGVPAKLLSLRVAKP